MKDPRNEKMAPDQQDAPRNEAGKSTKMPYSTPILIEYGTIAKLTQGTNSFFNDGTLGKTLAEMPCL